MTPEECRTIRVQLHDDIENQRLVATCTTFISSDDRQLAVAKATGLAVIDIKRRVQRIKR
jgi:hypothetical protein